MALAFAGAGLLVIALGACLAAGALLAFTIGGHWICLGYALLTQH